MRPRQLGLASRGPWGRRRSLRRLRLQQARLASPRRTTYLALYRPPARPPARSTSKQPVGAPMRVGEGCGFQSFKTNNYKLHFFESPSGIKVGGRGPALRHGAGAVQGPSHPRIPCCLSGLQRLFCHPNCVLRANCRRATCVR